MAANKNLVGPERGKYFPLVGPEQGRTFPLVGLE